MFNAHILDRAHARLADVMETGAELEELWKQYGCSKSKAKLGSVYTERSNLEYVIEREEELTAQLTIHQA